ncbi:MAG: 5-formyltetrahydrofolate cyclo-ligase [Planctomycetota bacterium]
MEKSEIRKAVAREIAEIPPDIRESAGREVLAAVRALPEYRRARTVMAYASLADELPTEDLLRAILADGKTLLLPRTESDGSLTPRAVADPARDLVRGRLGVSEPIPGPGHPPESIDLVLAPGRAFDPDGFRVGRGGAHYDRFLAGPGLRATTVGMAFHVQLREALPRETHDRPVDMIVTECGTIRVDTSGK